MDLEIWTSNVADASARVAERILELLPSAVGAAALLLFGWLVSHFLSKLTRHLVERGLVRLSRTKPLRARVQESPAYQSLPDVSARIVYWIALLFFLAVALEILGLSAVSNAVAYISAYLPRLLAGLIIVFAGFWIGELASTFLARAAASRGLVRTELIGRSAQALIVVLAVIIAIDQIGVDSTILVTLTVTVFAAIVGGAALAFGLGARSTVANILAAHYVRRLYRVGDKVSIDDVQGTIVELGSSTVSIETDNGRVTVPAEQFNTAISTRLNGGSA